MSVFPGDMSIGWGFGLYPQEESGNSTFEEGEMKREAYKELDFPFSDESRPPDPLLAVSESEQRVEYLERYERTLTNRISNLEKDMKERLRSLTLVVNELVERDEEFREVQNMTGAIYSVLNAEGALSEKEGETNHVNFPKKLTV